MNDFTPLPIPFSQRWRRFRLQALPLIVFGFAVLAVAFLWDHQSASPAISGEAIGTVSMVSAPRSGVIVGNQMELFQNVQEGHLLCWIRLTPEEHMLAALDALQAQIELARIGAADPVPDQQRNYINYQNLRRDWLQARADMAELKVREMDAARRYERLKSLTERQFVADAEMELVEAEYLSLQANLTEVQALVDGLEGAVNDMEQGAGVSLSGLRDAREAALKLYEKQLKQLELELRPFPVYAPIGGKISALFKQPGDFIPEGEVLLTVSADQPDFIVGYLKLPATVDPQAGMRVLVTRQGASSESGESTILDVGAQFQAIIPALQPILTQRQERALPLKIGLPEGMKLRPGELVSVSLLPASTGG